MPQPTALFTLLSLADLAWVDEMAMRAAMLCDTVTLHS